jgi:hypothetical protein
VKLDEERSPDSPYADSSTPSNLSNLNETEEMDSPGSGSMTARKLTVSSGATVNGDCGRKLIDTALQGRGPAKLAVIRTAASRRSRASEMFQNPRFQGAWNRLRNP